MYHKDKNGVEIRDTNSKVIYKGKTYEIFGTGYMILNEPETLFWDNNDKLVYLDTREVEVVGIDWSYIYIVVILIALIIASIVV
jgi:hypothetical protein